MNRSTHPLVTVTIPAYNAMPYLPAAVDSILRQTYTDFKLLIINDGSTDDTKDYLESLNDPRVTVIHQENQGVGATAHRFLELCDTPFCARMDADDISLPGRLAAQMERLESSPHIGIIGTQIAYLVRNKTIAALPFPTRDVDIRNAFLARRFPLCNPTLVFRTDIARTTLTRFILGYGEDVDIVLRLMETAKAANIGQVLFYQRIHSNSGTFKSAQSCATGVRYGIYCANLRRKGLKEPTFEQFQSASGLEGVLGRLADRREATATVHYRKHLIARADGAHLRAGAHLALTALCHPGAVASRISQRLRWPGLAAA